MSNSLNIDATALSAEAEELLHLMLQEAGVEAPTSQQIARRSPGTRAPLSYAQQRLWFLDQLEGATANYNLPAAVRLSGELNISALRRAFAELVRRHESLRTTFEAVDGTPYQVIHAAGDFALAVVDLSDLQAAEQERAVQLAARAEGQRAFDLAQGSLLRTRLLRLSGREHVLLLTQHHIVSDGWSMGILIRELTTLYEAYAAGRESPLPELEIQYADYACWQRQYLEGEVLERQLTYWRRQLDGELSPLNLPNDWPHRPLQGSPSAFEQISFTAEQQRELEAFSRRHGATLFMTLLAAFQVLLHRYSGQNDIVVGTPIANRNHAQVENLIGFFVNTLVLRANFSGDPSFSEFLERVRKTTLDAYDHQDLPFERLVEELKITRDLGRTPVFQVMFAMLKSSDAEAKPSTLRLSRLSNSDGNAMFDLTLTIDETENGLSASFQYDTALFKRSTIRQMMSHWQHLLEAVVADPDRKLSDLPLLTDTEVVELINRSTGPVTNRPPFDPIHRVFERHAAAVPDRIAVISGTESLTYAELNSRANQLARFLRRRGIGRESLVPICCERLLEMLVGWFGVLKAGAAFVALDPAYPPARHTAMLEDTGARLCITQRSLLARLPAKNIAEVICLDSDWDNIASESADNLSDEIYAENLACAIFTSGSTGSPKGAMISHGSLLNYVEAACSNYKINSRDRVLQFSSPSFDSGVEEIFVCLSSGATLVLRNDEIGYSTEALLAACREFELTVLGLPPAYWHHLALNTTAADWQDVPTVRLLMLGGEKIQLEALSRWSEITGDRIQVFDIYGPTETTLGVTMSDLAGVTSAGDFCGRLSIGQPIRNVEVYVLDEQLNVVPIGVPGEVHIGGCGLARGYLNSPALTAERFVPHPLSSEPGARLYRTGDQCRLLRDNGIEFLGRMDRQLKIHGYRVEPKEIEDALLEQQGVRQAVVLAARRPGQSPELVAYLVADVPDGLWREELRGKLTRRLPHYMVPSNFVLVTELPRTPNGKIDREALLKIEPAPLESHTPFVGPRNSIESQLVAIWQEYLSQSTIGIHQNFFELGGHSLLAMQVLARMRKTFGAGFELRAIFEYPTIAALAQHIAQSKPSAGSIPPIRRVSRDREIPLSFAQQRLWFMDHLEPGSPAFNIPMAVTFTETPDLAALRRAFNKMIERHEVLRTRFAATVGRPRQIIHECIELDLATLDLSALSPVRQASEARAFATAYGERPFDLSCAPLLRAIVLRLSGRHLLLIVLHHIVADGWSLNILRREVTTLYEAFRSGASPRLPKLEIQYADYACWQRDWMSGPVFETQLNYWRSQLRGIRPLELKPDKSIAASPRSTAGRYEFVISQELKTDLEELAGSQGATLFMLLLAAFAVVLAHRTGETDVAVGAHAANRNTENTENLIGFFVNMLVMRIDLSGNPTLSELIMKVKAMALGAYANQDLPFEKLVDVLSPKRELGRHPLFNIVFALENDITGEDQLSSNPLADLAGNSVFALSLTMTNSGAELRGSLLYKIDLFEESSIARLANAYQQVVASFKPETRLQTLFETLDSLEREEHVHKAAELHSAGLRRLKARRSPNAHSPHS